MNLYAIRDRLLNYFLNPFVGPSDKQVLAAIAQTINGDDRHAIQQAPQHFEVWRLAKIEEETGKVTPAYELLADCTSLIRGGLRRDTDNTNGGRDQIPQNARESTTGSPGTPGATGARNRPPTADPLTTDLANREAHPGVSGGPEPPQGHSDR